MIAQRKLKTVDRTISIIIPEPQENYTPAELSFLGKYLLGSAWWPTNMPQFKELNYEQLIWPQVVEIIRAMAPKLPDKDSNDDEDEEYEKIEIAPKTNCNELLLQEGGQISKTMNVATDPPTIATPKKASDNSSGTSITDIGLILVIGRPSRKKSAKYCKTKCC
jgi:hypothetical protein